MVLFVDELQVINFDGDVGRLSGLNIKGGLLEKYNGYYRIISLTDKQWKNRSYYRLNLRRLGDTVPDLPMYVPQPAAC